MDLTKHILSSAEQAFDLHGFSRSGVDQLTTAANVSSRTFYKHVGNKNALTAAVLRERSERFFKCLNAESVDTLFASLQEWARLEGSRGCFFLRALGETGGEIPEIAQAVAAYRQELFETVSACICKSIRGKKREHLAEQLLILFEGAVSTAGYRGAHSITYAREVAVALLDSPSEVHADVGPGANQKAFKSTRTPSRHSR